MLVAAPWFVAMAQHHGLAYVHRFFIGENLERFATDRYNEPRPLWFYVPIVLGGLMPWSPFILLWLPTWRRVFRGERMVTRAEWRAIIWAAVPFVFYSASIGKQPRYILPMLPPMALLLARTVIARLPDEAAASLAADRAADRAGVVRHAVRRAAARCSACCCTARARCSSS